MTRAEELAEKVRRGIQFKPSSEERALDELVAQAEALAEALEWYANLEAGGGLGHLATDALARHRGEKP